VPAAPTITALDNCDEDVPVYFEEVQSNPGSSCNNTITRTWTAEDDCGNPVSCTQTIVVNDNVKPDISCPAWITVCVGEPIDIGEPVVSDNCDEDLLVENNAPESFPLGSTWITWSVTDDCGNSRACMQKVVVNALPTCSITIPNPLPVCGVTGNNLTVTTNADTYEWSVVSSDNSWVITSATNLATITYTAGNSGVVGTFTVIVTNSATGCSKSCTVTFGSRCEEHCTYTQGFYGGNGTSCNGTPVLTLLNSLLSTPLVNGCNTRTVTIGTTEASCLKSKMPAGTTAAVLPVGNVSCAGATGSAYLKNGKFKSVLLGQTIALGLNLRGDASLGSLQITNKYLTTYDASACSNGAAIPGTKLVFTIPQNVINYLNANTGTYPGGATVANLLKLANNALGTCYVPSGSNPKLSDINSALDAINRGFDECRIFSSFSNSSGGQRPEDEGSTSSEFLAGNLSVYPNPTDGNFVIDFDLGEEVDATADLAIVNMIGRYVLAGNVVVTSGHLVYQVAFNSDVPAGMYIVQVLVDGQRYHAQLVYQK